jgi:hypothetical protein
VQNGTCVACARHGSVHDAAAPNSFSLVLVPPSSGSASWEAAQEVASQHGLRPDLLKFSGVKLADVAKPGMLDKVDELGKQNRESGWCGECA